MTIELRSDSISDLVAPQKSPIAHLPASISCFKVKNTSGATFWRVRVGKKFTGGLVILKNFASLGDAKEWILGETQKLRAKPGSLIELKALAGNAAFRLSPAQITEAADAFRRLSETSLTLTEAVSYAIQHACPTAGTLSVADAIKAAQKAKSGRRPAYRADMFRRWRRLERWLPAITVKQ